MSAKHEAPTLKQICELPVSLEFVIPEEYRDTNGHMNVRHFHDLHARTTDAMFVRIGFPDAERKHGVFGLESRTRFYSEVHIGERVTGHNRLLTHDGRFFHGVGFLVAHGPDRVATAFEYLIAGVDLDERRIAQLPEKNQLLAAAEIARVTVTWPPPVFDRISL